MGALRPFILITAVADLSVTLATDAAGAYSERCPTVALCKRRPDVPGVDETRQTQTRRRAPAALRLCRLNRRLRFVTRALRMAPGRKVSDRVGGGGAGGANRGCFYCADGQEGGVCVCVCAC